jgi:hypothetical protein
MKRISKCGRHFTIETKALKKLPSRELKPSGHMAASPKQKRNNNAKRGVQHHGR